MHGIFGSVLLAYPQNKYEERAFWLDPTIKRVRPPTCSISSTRCVKNTELALSNISKIFTVVAILNHKDGSRQTSITLFKG